MAFDQDYAHSHSNSRSAHNIQGDDVCSDVWCEPQLNNTAFVARSQCLERKCQATVMQSARTFVDWDLHTPAQLTFGDPA